MAVLGGADAGYSPIQSLKPRKGVGSGLAGVINTPPKPPAPLTTGPIGAASGGGGSQTTTTVMQPNQVYQDEILSAPESVAAQGIFGATTSNLAAARADAIQRAVISGGWDPSGKLGGSLQSYAGDITPQTLASAAANPMSQKAQLDLQLSQANQNQPYDLAASGMGRSGAAAINAGNLQRQYQSASYSGLNDLLNSIYGAANTYAGGYNNAVNQLEYARSLAAQRLQQAAGYSQSVTTSGGDPGGGADPNLAGDYGTYVPPDTSQVVQRVIASLGGNAAKSPRIYQNVRNILAG